MRVTTAFMSHESKVIIIFYNVPQTNFSILRKSHDSERTGEKSSRSAALVIVHGIYGFEEQLTHSKCLFTLLIRGCVKPLRWYRQADQNFLHVDIVWLSLSRKHSLFM